MSLVERALKKMQSNATGSASPSDVPARFPAQSTAPAVEAPARTQQVVPPVPSRGAVNRTVPFNVAGLRAEGLLPPEHQDRQIARQYRQIKRPLIASALGHGGPALPKGSLIMVASAMPGEGKTFTSINLALSIARERDVRVLLIDADAPKPHLSRLFGLTGEPGLLDLVRNPEMSVEQAVFPTDVPNLSLVPSGQQSENATELFASTRMHDVARLLAARDPNCIVLFDSPPLVLTTESHALAQVVGQVVVVVRADVTPRDALVDAIQWLGDRPASLVLNQSVAPAYGDYYYYGSGGYGSVPGDGP